MADLNTRAKRASSVQIMAPYILAPPEPNGSLSTQDKKHILWLYAGGQSAPRLKSPFAGALAGYEKFE